MTTYGKLSESGSLEILYIVPGVTNPSEATKKKYAEANGYLPVSYTDSPGEWYDSGYTQEDTRILQVWTEWTNEQKIPVIQSNTQVLLDSTAAERNYDNIFTALTYLQSTNAKFKAEAEALRDWRDEVWTELYAYLDKVEKGEATIPDNWEAVKAVLPKFVWPVVAE